MRQAEKIFLLWKWHTLVALVSFNPALTMTVTCALNKRKYKIIVEKGIEENEKEGGEEEHWGGLTH